MLNMWRDNKFIPLEKALDYEHKNIRGGGVDFYLYRFYRYYTRLIICPDILYYNPIKLIYHAYSSQMSDVAHGLLFYIFMGPATRYSLEKLP